MRLSPDLEAACLRLADPPAIPEPAFATEKEFLAAVMGLAKRRCWRLYHTHDSRKSNAGFPDLVLVRNTRVVWAELKTDQGQPTAAQVAWIEDLRDAGQEVYLWRPSDWPTIEEVLL